MDSKILIKEVSHDDPYLNDLFDELDKELANLYPEEAIFGGGVVFGLDMKKKPKNAEKFYFIIAYVSGQAVGCGCIKPLSKYSCELKRMFVKEGFRKKGIAAEIFKRLESEALKRGYKKILLETGPRQPEAIALYEKLGFKERGIFGKYKLIDELAHLSVFFEKEIV